MTQKFHTNAISGDVAIMANVTLNTKGGSTTAIIKKPLRDRLGKVGDHLAAATLEFATGQALILLMGAIPGVPKGRAPLRVRRTGRNRFEIELESDGDAEIDEVTAAFLRLKKHLFEKGKLRLSEAVTAEEWRTAMDKKIAVAEAAMKKVEAKPKIGGVAAADG